MKLAIVSTHPIQYYAPVFRAIAASTTVLPRVFYTWSQAQEGNIFDRGFGVGLKWDIPLLDGYEYEFVPNAAKDPGLHHFGGVRNPTLIETIRKWKADAILVYGWNLLSHLRVMQHFKRRIPVYFRGDSTLIDAQPRLRSWLRRALLRQIYRYVDVAIAVGQNNADYFKWCGIPSHRVAYAPHSIDTARFADAAGGSELQATAWRNQLGIGEGERVILFAGKLVTKKDPLLLLRAFMDSCAHGHLVYVGNGALEPELRARAAQHPRVHFMPFQNQASMPSVYRLGDIFALPSVGPGETWGLAVNEALASGRPAIVSSKVGGARDVIMSGQNGWVFEAGNYASLVAVLSTAMALDGQALQAMGRRGRDMAGDWSSEVAAQRICESVHQRW